MEKAWYQRIFNPVNYCQYLVHSLKHNDVLAYLSNINILLSSFVMFSWIKVYTISKINIFSSFFYKGKFYIFITNR
ncbi:hypothetical protein B7468_09475 [Staphylococcus lugdunensis]|nr:hypothetical protein B7468_09475 [Staphylococcus lugdunensis]